MERSRPGLVDRLVRRLLVALAGYGSAEVDTSVGPIHVLTRAGDGALPPVVLIHGFGAAATQWVPLIRALRPHVRAITAIDLPGHGFSHRRSDLSLEVLRDGVIEALDRVHTEPAVIIGNSLGGAVVVRYVNARPERAIGAVLLSPGGAPMTDAELEAVRALFRVVSHADALAFLDRLFARSLGWIRHLLAPGVRRVFRDEALHGLLARVTAADWLTADEVSGLSVPVRVVWGQQDKILPATSLAFWRRHLPGGAEVDEPATLGHVPQLDAPHLAASDIVAFVRRLGG